MFQDIAISKPHGDVDAEEDTVHDKDPKDVWEEKELDLVLHAGDSFAPVGFVNEQYHI